jgi:signal transduction histidine kinase
MGLVQQGLLQDPESRLNRHFTVLKQECQREIQLINDLLELSRLQSSLDSHLPA